MNLCIVAGVESTWHYHLADAESNRTVALCNTAVMRTGIPLNGWGQRGHLDEQYCEKCGELSEPKDLPAADLLALIAWTRTALGHAIDMRPGEQRDGALRAIARALDPESNPRLGRIAQKGKRMRTGIYGKDWNDADGNPEGGQMFGTGFAIAWQRGPLGRGDQRRQPNGAFVEDVLLACASRLEFYQRSKFACAANAEALVHISAALDLLDARTKDREARAVEGTHEV